jgi:hypothetical protein
MDNATFQRIKDLLLQHQDIGVLVGPNPDFDQMAAGLGLFLSIKQMGKNVSIASPTDPLVSVSSLVGIDKVQRNLGGEEGDLTVSFPYKEGEIEKVSYTLENGLLNIVVKAGEKGLSFEQSDVMFKRGGKLPTLLFFVGIARMSDIAALYAPEAGKEVDIVNIDNKQNNEKYGTIAVVDQRWSSISEQVADFVTLLEPQIELDADTAQNLLNGIAYATQDFTSPRTSYLAFEVAGILMKKGATRQKAQMIISSSNAGAVANAESFFPPVSQPQQQPRQQIPSTPPVRQDTSQQTQQFQPQQQQQSSESSQPTPPDWLTPKVYKGSTVL